MIWKRFTLCYTFEVSIFSPTKQNSMPMLIHSACSLKVTSYSMVSRILCYGCGCSIVCLTILSVRGRWSGFSCGNHTNTHWYKHLYTVPWDNRLHFSGKIPRRANAGLCLVFRGHASWALVQFCVQISVSSNRGASLVKLHDFFFFKELSIYSDRKQF